MKKFMLFICLRSPAVGFAQSYTIDWNTIDDGGSTSTGGLYSVCESNRECSRQ